MKKIFLSGALLLASTITMAADFKYTYGEVGFGEGRGDGEGLFIGGAVDLQQGFGIVGAYYALDYERGLNEDGDLDIFTIGMQYHTQLNTQADFVGSIQMIHAELDRNRGDIDDTGLLLRGGIRYAFQQNLHLEGDLSYITNDFWDDDELGVKVGLRFYPASQLSMAVGAANDQELDGLYISGRYDFY